MPRYPRTLKDVDMITRTLLGQELIFRRAPGTEFLVTSCGQFVINAYYDHKITHLSRTDKFRYLKIDGNSVHVLVAKAWVWNPSPTRFKVCDHIDRDVFNNAASNLRYITSQLNSLNRERSMARKIKHQRKTGKWSIYWRSIVNIEDVEYSGNYSTKSACEENTRRVINDAFARIYEEATQGTSPPRADHLFYWQDDTPLRASLVDTGTGGVSEAGEKFGSLSCECDDSGSSLSET